MDDNKDRSDSQLMTYEEYVKRYSVSDNLSKETNDDPQDIAEFLASETMAIFKQSLAASS